MIRRGAGRSTDGPDDTGFLMGWRSLPQPRHRPTSDLSPRFLLPFSPQIPEASPLSPGTCDPLKEVPAPSVLKGS